MLAEQHGAVNHTGFLRWQPYISILLDPPTTAIPQAILNITQTVPSAKYSIKQRTGTKYVAFDYFIAIISVPRDDKQARASGGC